jgi:uncharacterized protein (TIGR02996 family)
MHTNGHFLAQLLNDPSDDPTRLVYADWLEDQGDPVSLARAEFLRLTVELAAGRQSGGAEEELRKRLQALAADLDTDWLAVVSRLDVENCYTRRREWVLSQAGPVRFDFLCDRRWEDMQPTEDGAVRFCDACEQNVHYCDTIVEARRHAWAGHCIAVDLGVIRRDQDLVPPRTLRGRVSVQAIQRERLRLRLDKVSARREREKRRKKREEAKHPAE